MAVFTPRFLRQLRDVLIGTPADNDVLTYDTADGMWKPAAGGGGGVTDHGALTGLADDDHPQYTTTAEAQALVDTHVNDATAAHAASAISADSTTLVGTGTDVQAVLEELDNAIAAGDLSLAVILAPAASARNTIAPAANVLALRIITADGDDASKNMIEAYNNGSAIPGNFLFDIDSGGGSAWTLRDPIAKFEIDANTGQTAEIFLVYSGDLDQASGFDKRARLFTQVTTAPADGDVKTGYVYLYYDKTNGAAKLMAKGKTADGTVVTFALPSGVASIVGHAHAGEDVTSGTVADARIAATIARDSEVSAAVATEASDRATADALLVPKSLYDADTILAASVDNTPAAIPLTSFIRTLLDDASAAAARTTLGITSSQDDLFLTRHVCKR